MELVCKSTPVLFAVRLLSSKKCVLSCALADGYARSDGVAVMLLQKAKYAKRIYATVVHSAVEICGDRMTPLITPMREPFINLLERFYQTCGVDPTSLQFLEADGSGIKVIKLSTKFIKNFFCLLQITKILTVQTSKLFLTNFLCCEVIIKLCNNIIFFGTGT
jgi:fatty acid synthase